MNNSFNIEEIKKNMKIYSKNIIYIGGNWSELGVGTNYNISESTYIYAEAIRSFGSSFETPWEVNAGLRVDF